MQVETGNWKQETIGHFMAEVTLPQFPEPRIRPNVSHPTHRVPKLRDVSPVFQFIHSRSFDASGQSPVSRIAVWGQIPDSKFQVLSVHQGPEYRFQIPGRALAHFQVRENTSGGVSHREAQEYRERVMKGENTVPRPGPPVPAGGVGRTIEIRTTLSTQKCHFLMSRC
eukprot:1112856-Prymnesium_polylepis.1